MVEVLIGRESGHIPPEAHGAEQKVHAPALHTLRAVLDAVIEEKLFDELWTQRSAEEKAALQKLASAKTLTRADAAMRALAREGITLLNQDHATIAVPLFAAWIRLTQGRIED